MIDAGISGCLSKQASGEQLVGAIRRIVQGEILFNQIQFGRAKRWKEEVGEILDQLTTRERQILDLLAKGMDNNQVGEALTIKAKTVAYHVTNLMAKIRVSSRQEAAIWALKNLSDNLE